MEGQVYRANVSIYKVLTRRKKATLLTLHFLALAYRVFVLFFCFFILKRPEGLKCNRVGLGCPRHPTLSNVNGKKRSRKLHFQHKLCLLVKNLSKTQVVSYKKWMKRLLHQQPFQFTKPQKEEGSSKNVFIFLLASVKKQEQNKQEH